MREEREKEAEHGGRKSRLRSFGVIEIMVSGAGPSLSHSSSSRIPSLPPRPVLLLTECLSGMSDHGRVILFLSLYPSHFPAPLFPPPPSAAGAAALATLRWPSSPRQPRPPRITNPGIPPLAAFPVASSSRRSSSLSLSSLFFLCLLYLSSFCFKCSDGDRVAMHRRRRESMGHRFMRGGPPSWMVGPT